jgi:hypothetical protein
LDPDRREFLDLKQRDRHADGYCTTNRSLISVTRNGFYVE